MDASSFSNALVLVTGGAGFIGSHLVEGLAKAGARVRVLDDLSTGKRDNLARARGIELLEGDIRDVEVCRRACQGVAHVFHQAALGSVPRSMDDPSTTIAVNVAGTANVFAAARDAGVTRVVYASSSSVYGDSETLPKREGEEGAPLSPYALSKVMDEELAEVYARCYGMSFVGLRYFNVYGPRQDPAGPYAAVVPRFFAACASGEPPVIFGDGEQKRDFTYVGDVVRANMLAALARVSGAQVVNIGAGGSTTVTELADTIVRVTKSGVRPRYVDERAGDVRFSQADTRRARELLGWQAEIQLADGLAKTNV
jgi:nucleoside-diphosphate-sugar epimerase